MTEAHLAEAIPQDLQELGHQMLGYLPTGASGPTKCQPGASNPSAVFSFGAVAPDPVLHTGLCFGDSILDLELVLALEPGKVRFGE